MGGCGCGCVGGNVEGRGRVCVRMLCVGGLCEGRKVGVVFVAFVRSVLN